MPIFSGSIDPYINRMDLGKVLRKLRNKPRVSKEDLNLYSRLVQVHKSLLNKEINIAYWSGYTLSGSIPHSREGHTSCLLGNQLYMFGGFSQDIFGDLRCIDLVNYKSVLLPSDSETPSARS